MNHNIPRIDEDYFYWYSHWEDDCLVWHSSWCGSRSSHPSGYCKHGKITRIEDDRRIHFKAHRAHYCVVHDKDYYDESFWVRHTCNNTLCINPEHMEEVTIGASPHSKATKEYPWL